MGGRNVFRYSVGVGWWRFDRRLSCCGIWTDFFHIHPDPDPDRHHSSYSDDESSSSSSLDDGSPGRREAMLERKASFVALWGDQLLIDVTINQDQGGGS